MKKIMYLCNVDEKAKYNLTTNPDIKMENIPSTAADKRAEDITAHMQIAVCSQPDGNGFSIEHMPEMFNIGEFDNAKPHFHHFYEILWFQRGEGTHTVDFMPYEVKENTVFFLSPGQIHHFDHNGGYEGVSIKMCTNFLRDEGGERKLFVKYNAFHAYDALPYYRIDAQTASSLSTIVQLMEEEERCAEAFGNTDVIKALLRVFLIRIQRHGQRDGVLQLDNLKPAHLLFIRFRQMVEQNYHQLHTVQEYASRLGVAQRTLGKCVNECAGTSPLAFINGRVILEAKRMVKYSNLMVKEIAYRLGYDDPSYFVKFFKRQTGFLPHQFREKDVDD